MSAKRTDFGCGLGTLLFWCLACGLLLAYVRVLLLFRNSDGGQLVMFFVGVALLIAISEGRTAVLRAEQTRVQKRRDYAAAALRVAIKPSRPLRSGIQFYLFLRPFTATGDIKIGLRSGMTKWRTANIARNYYPRFGYTSAYRRDVEWGDLETLLAEQLTKLGPLIALGKPGEQIGAGRLSAPEETWHDDFAALANAAKIIFIVPSSHKGTRFELDHLLSHSSLRAKTVLVIPPDLAYFGVLATLGATFGLGAVRHISHDSQLRADALKTIKSAGLSSAAAIDELGALICLSHKGVRSTLQLLTYEKPLMTFSLNYFAVEQLSLSDLRQMLRDLEMEYDNPVSPQQAG